MEKSGRLLLFHFDHLSGEEAGVLIEMLHEWGAADVQILPTLTKKNRPGHLALLDIEPSDEPRFAAALASQFGISGYHRLETTHCHRAVRLETAALTARCGTREIGLSVRFKRLLGEDAGGVPRVEFDDLREAVRRIGRELGATLDVSSLGRRLEALLAAGEPLLLDIAKDE